MDDHEAMELEITNLRASLVLIANIGEGSTTANSLPHIAKIAREALAYDPRDQETLTQRPTMTAEQWEQFDLRR